MQSKRLGRQKDHSEAAYVGSIASEAEYQLDWSASLKGCLGYSFGRVMVFGSGGISALQQTGTRRQYAASASGTASFFVEQDTTAKLGWSLGGGEEYALTNNWSIKGEYSCAS